MLSSNKITVHTLITNAVTRHITADADKKILISFLEYLIPIAQSRFNASSAKDTYDFDVYFTWYVGEVINTYDEKRGVITSPILIPQWSEWQNDNKHF